MVCLAPEERMVPRGQRVVWAPLVSWDHWAWWERRVNLVFQDFLVTLADWDLRDPSVSQDSLVPTARRERGD